MTDEILNYYNEELAYLREQGKEFSKVHPKIASRLKLGTGSFEDPLVGELVESFAFLTARIRHKLDDEFSEINEALLNILYPHYQLPMPTLSIIQILPDPKSDAVFYLPRNTALKSIPIKGIECRFKTAYEMDLLPAEIADVSLSGTPFMPVSVQSKEESAASLKIKLKVCNSQIDFEKINTKHFRFYINSDPYTAYALYEAIFRQANFIAIQNSSLSKPILLSKNVLKPVGFSDKESLLPYPSHAFQGYRLLTEFFVFPEKFLFFDLNLDSVDLENLGKEFEILIYLKEYDSLLEKRVTKNSLLLNCTPIINLFEVVSENIRLDHTKTEYQIVPASRKKIEEMEIYSVKKVYSSVTGEEKIEYQPFFGLKHGASRTKRYWHARRKPVWHLNRSDLEGHEMYLSFAHEDYHESHFESESISAELICSNRDLAAQLPLRAETSVLSFAESLNISFKQIEFVSQLTPVLRTSIQKQSRWQLISHLSLGYLSLSEMENSVDALREILKLYNFKKTPDTDSLIESISSIKTRSIIARHPDDMRQGFCHGLEITLNIDEKKLTGHGLFLFASILEHFFALYCSINSFTQLILNTKQRGELARWQPRIGEKTLL